MNCPVCNQAMVEIPTGLICSGFDLVKFRCEGCKIIARVETTYSSYIEPPSPTSNEQHK